MTYANISASCLPYITPVHMCLYVYSDEAPKRPKKAGEERERKKNYSRNELQELVTNHWAGN